jgi:hypothetical protein
MRASLDQLNTMRELLEVEPFRRSERMLMKERDDPFQQIAPLANDVPVQVLAMVVLSTVRQYLSDSEEILELVEAFDAFLALCHHELVRYLVASSVASSPRPVCLPNEADREASFSVYKADHPATELDQSFLLIVRITRHVVTIVDAQSDDTISSAGYPGFPAYGQMRTMPLPAWGAAFYLRTVIVTAAVYRGLDSRLRPKANLSS